MGDALASSKKGKDRKWHKLLKKGPFLVNYSTTSLLFTKSEKKSIGYATKRKSLSISVNLSISLYNLMCSKIYQNDRNA